jgi:hypothetical protein
MKRSLVVAVAVVLLVAGSLVAGSRPPTAAAASLFDGRRPGTTSHPDRDSVELGVRFSSDVSGTVDAIRFYKSADNVGAHTASLWTATGERLATTSFTAEKESGWQTAKLSPPVRIQAGTEYVASYLAPSGRYAGDAHAFDRRYTKGHLTVPDGGGVFGYGSGGFPRQVWQNYNYYVDVSFVPERPSAAPTTPPRQPPVESVRDLPRVAWEGGPAYYAQFPRSKAFADPAVFPIGVWWADFETDANVKWDKDHGVNFYVQLNGTEDGSLLARNGMYWVGAAPLRNMSRTAPSWVGYWLSDETDGRYDPPSAGHAQMQKEIDAQRGPNCPTSTYCRFDYANYTTIVTSDYNATQIANDEKYVNMYRGPVSVDGYYYTDPHCDVPKALYGDAAHNPPDYEHCRTAAGYGNLISTLRLRDAADESLKPLWGFLENGAPNDQNGKSIAPAQMKAAAMSMIIHEARGLVWFNQSFSGTCRSGNVIRDAEANPHGCNVARVEAMKQINTQIQALAPVLNSQSYVWNFRAQGVDTMLKEKDGSAYVFAGVGLNQDPGTKTFTLPPGISGQTVEVVGESRTLPVHGGTFTDSFRQESSYHVYRIGI